MTEYIDINSIITNILEISIDLPKSPDCENIFELENIIGKIINNLNIIVQLYINNLIYTNNIFSSLKNIKMSEYNNKLLYYKKIKKTLGYIIFEIYRDSGYNVLLSNIPTLAKPRLYRKSMIVDSEVIFDTIEYYIGSDTVDSVLQVSEYNYLVKIKDLDNCKKLCDLINRMQINNNIINACQLISPAKIFENIPVSHEASSLDKEWGDKVPDVSTKTHIEDFPSHSTHKKSLIELGTDTLYYLYNMISSVFKFTTGQ